ncbi:LysR family transcriptional regulator [Pseudoxanthomonas sacheonensis]|uniref:LysR family transcriptional regulator n=1 Tax=Pseudoxanthomonas sacheonensis TaxID=443615 RepID=UPI0013D111FD|nr:LysR family transcriptional regulator [Pseudoxanthomonas sacheonensis]KAF1710125.1 LysR family transcriptional regulator [Pseudoxanthomonas sacheonensis]
MIQIADMAAFVAVMETASFTEAARRLTTTKSVISRRVSDLERELGAPLLDRGARSSVRATEVGAVYYAKCVRILESIGAANDFVAGFNSLVRGRLRIALAESFNGALIAPLLNEFAERYPEVLLDIQADDEYINLGDSHFDAAIRVGRLGDANLIARPLAGFRKWLCASPAYLQAHGVPQSPDDLAEHHGLIDTSGEGLGDWQLWVDGEARNCRVRERIRSNSGEQLISAACAGLGIVQASSILAADAIVSGQLRIVLPECAPPASQISVVYPRSRRASQKVQVLLSFLSERIAAVADWDDRIAQAQATR